MAKYLLKRLGMAVLTLFVILLLLFIMVHSLPGSPFNNAEKLTEAQKAAMNAKYGLDKPLLTQFFIYFSNVLKGDFGTSYSFASDIRRAVRADRRGYRAFHRHYGGIEQR